MTRTFTNALACILAVTLAAGAAAQSLEIRMKNGTRWRGELQEQVKVTYMSQGAQLELSGVLTKVSDLYVQIEGDLGGQVRAKTIFRADIVKMETLAAAAAEAGPSADIKPAKGAADGAAADSATSARGLFFLPLEGPVGDAIRAVEIKKIGEHADKFGPGQIIVLKIRSNGGLVLEAEFISDEIHALKKRHRVIAWVEKAISAGCVMAMCCNEIYFMTTGVAGSVTTLAGNRSLPEEQVKSHVQNLVDVAVESGYSEHIARAMKFNHYMCSYDKSPETGEVTWYGDLSGQYVLSDGESNLCFSASNALHCGFSKGTADTEEELARLLDLPKWHEIDDYGRQIAEEWKTTVERATEDIQRQMARLNYYKAAGDAEEQLGARIQILSKLISWWDKAPEVARMMLPEKAVLERQLAELKKQLADLQRAQRR